MMVAKIDFSADRAQAIVVQMREHNKQNPIVTLPARVWNKMQEMANRLDPPEKA